MKCLFVPVGSEGDVNPLLWLADGMAARGHEPVFLVTPHYGGLVAQHGFEWHPIGTEEDFLRAAREINFWKPLIGTWRVVATVTKSFEEYRSTFEALEASFDLVVTSSLGLAASSIAEARGIPRLMLHLQPASMWSRYELPIPSAGLGWLCATPSWIKQAGFCAMKFGLNTAFLPQLNTFRRSLGLSAIRSYYDEAFMGPEGVALLFPSWFLAPQPDWPTKVQQFDFPLSLNTSAPLPDALEEWLSTGTPPILWTCGSANMHVEKFHKLAIKVTQIFGGRALLVSQKAPAVRLPDTMLHVSHVPFEDVFSRCRAVVHHAGIGTTAKALAAGIPQLALPLAHDQHDNANRIVRLRAGLQCVRRRNPGLLANRLNHLLHSSEISEGVLRCQQWTRQSPASSEKLSLWAEELART